MTTSPTFRRVGTAVVTLILVGSLAFGLWHVTVGGGLHGNPRAAMFGAVLATICAALLGLLALRIRRGNRGR